MPDFYPNMMQIPDFDCKIRKITDFDPTITKIPDVDLEMPYFYSEITKMPDFGQTMREMPHFDSAMMKFTVELQNILGVNGSAVSSEPDEYDTADLLDTSIGNASSKTIWSASELMLNSHLGLPLPLYCDRKANYNQVD